MSNRIVFIDSHIHNYQSLIAQLPKGAEAVLLDAGRDGSGKSWRRCKVRQTLLQSTSSRTAHREPSRSVRAS